MAKERKNLICDGNKTAAHVAYMFSEVAANGCKNILTGQLKLVEIQSKAGVLHGSLQADTLSTKKD